MSEFVRPKGLSILAGCGGALSYTRCALYEVMDFMHSKYLPRCNIQTYVDDTPQTHTGPKEIVLLEAVNQAVDFVQQLNMHGFTISGKSTIIASDMRLSCDIQVELAKHNIDIQVAASGRDVGTDFTAGGRRRITIQRTRANAVKRG